ncbi:MAG: hypothetical protein ACLTG4_08795 [Oscillospiraceae bacterium]
MRASLGALHVQPNLTEENLTGESTPEGIVAALLAQGAAGVSQHGGDGILAGAHELVHRRACPPAWSATGRGDAVMAALVWAYLAG